MKVAIFGTGDCCRRFTTYLKDDEIVFYIDNDKEKQKGYMKGKRIYSPQDAPYSMCDRIIVLVLKYHDVVQQLLDMGMQEEKIFTYADIVRENELLPHIVQSTGITGISEWIGEHQNKKVLCITHDLSRSGVPVLMLNEAVLLKEMGYDVLFSALGDGNLKEELEANDIDYMTNIDFFYETDRFLEIVKEFDLFWFGTIVLYKTVDKFAKFEKPILWWIHESHDMFYKECYLPDKKYMKNIHLLAGGKRPLRKVQSQFPDAVIEEFLYYLPKTNIAVRENKANNKIVFACVGAICTRKAQDILLKAIEKLSAEEAEKCEFIFAGPMSDTFEYCSKFQESLKNCVYKGEISQEEIALLYKQIDILVCPSRDDPMPLVVSQAMQNDVCCIISDQVGQAEFIHHKKNGLVFESENIEELAACIKWIINNASDIKALGEASGEVFHDKFSKEVMKENVQAVFRKIGF